jgi:hypothetical protein
VNRIDAVTMLPHMPQPCIDYLAACLETSASFLEYGAGGSTVLAHSLQTPQIRTIESDARWLEGVMQTAEGLLPRYTGRYTGTHVNIGTVGDWGHPTDNSRHMDYWRYPATPWLEVAGHAPPDLVLIDGRFRVACCLMTLIYAQPGTKILFDDYRPREHYHIVERFMQPVDQIGRMAIFMTPDRPSIISDILEALLPALQDPR